MRKGYIIFGVLFFFCKQLLITPYFVLSIKDSKKKFKLSEKPSINLYSLHILLIFVVTLLYSNWRKKFGGYFFSRFDWFQTKTTVTLVVYTKWKSMKSDFVVIDKQGNDFLATLYIEDYIYYLHIGK